MKRIYFISLLFLFFTLTEAKCQFKYKIRYEVAHGLPNQQQIEYWANQFFGPQHVIYSEISNIAPELMMDDYIYTSNNEITGYVSTSGDVMLICTDGGEMIPYNGITDSILLMEWSCAPGFSGFFFANYLRDLADWNPNLTQINICEPSQIKVATGVEMTYALTYFNIETEEYEILLPYGINPSHPIIDPSEIPDIDNYNNLLIQVQYTDDPNNLEDRSDVLILDLIPCVPVLDPDVPDNLVGLPVTCHGDGDGGITAIFDRALTEEESIQFVFMLGEDGVHDSPPLTQADFDGNTLTYEAEAGLPTGGYTMQWIVKVGNDAIGGGEAPVTILEPEPITFDLNKTDPKCSGSSNGEITVANLSGGNGDYVFEWQRNGEPFDLPEGSTDANPVNLPTGNYSLLVTDVLGCQSGILEIELVALAESPQLDSYLIFQAGEPPNFLPTGSIILEQVSGGNGNYVYDWTKDGQLFFPNDPLSLTELEPGDYTVIITDDNGQGCSSEEEDFTINELPPLEVFIAEDVSITCEGDIGILEANPTGGTNGGYEYLWSTGETTKSIEVGQGMYSVTVTDNSDGLEEAFYQFDYINPLLKVEAVQSNSICKGEDFGSIQLNISGGTGGPYEISWLDGPVTEALKENLPIGEYVYFVSDGQCQVTNEEEPIILTEPETGIEVKEVSKTNISINAAEDGTLNVNIENGVPPFTYEWKKNGEPFVPSPESTDTELVGLGEGSYQVVVSDANGCSASLGEPIIIYEPEPLEIVELSPTHVSCNGDATGSITASVTGIPPFNYVWEKQGQVTFSAPNSATIIGLTEGTYTLRLTDDSVVSEVVDIVVLKEPLQKLGANLTPFPTECFIGDEGTIDITAFGGTPPYTYSIDGGSNFQGGSTFFNLEAGEYSVLIRDNNSCELVKGTTVGLPDQIQAEFAVASQVFVNETIVAVDLSYPVPETVEWTVPETALVLKQDNDELELRFTSTGEYEVGIKVFKDNCWSQRTKKIIVLEKDGLIGGETEAAGNEDRIEEFIVYPNPTTGAFTVDIKLGKVGNIGLRVFGFANNNLILQTQSGGAKHYDIPMNIEGLPSGIYVIVLETPYGTALRKLILQ
ncbi:hypothetical protein HME9304_00026 [Flagellimonas maritima]|uniref:Secretion system C-terminal sorting domain-containing protein n=1 Tax=Flagellimonas maritima TaxID=1383885 RepID=A0A2Z4LMN4_9FLAO|nr:T9SS type A sorting domain-containing protein [Allomuricauda aurantiaca]AWX43039.1 hypothetical protein HME9304_00026 [Allomuricauda aurantiaca]